MALRDSPNGLIQLPPRIQKWRDSRRRPGIDLTIEHATMPNEDLYYLSATGLSAAIRARRLSPVELPAAILDPIEHINTSSLSSFDLCPTRYGLEKRCRVHKGYRWC